MTYLKSFSLLSEEKEYCTGKYTSTNSNLLTYEELKSKVNSRKITMLKYVRIHLTNNNIIERSNGEFALEFWENKKKCNISVRTTRK